MTLNYCNNELSPNNDKHAEQSRQFSFGQDQNKIH